jgi:hypothetical protein
MSIKARSGEPSVHLHPTNRSLWVSVTLVWLMVSGSCQAALRAIDLLSPTEESVPTPYLLLRVASLAFAIVLAVGAWGAWRWRPWGYVATVAALSCIVTLNVRRAAYAGWNSGEANLFVLLSAALVVPVFFSLIQFLDHRRQMAALSDGSRDPK